MSTTTELCDLCGRNPRTAIVHLAVNGQQSVAGLCAQCAQETMLSPSPPSALMANRSGAAVGVKAPPVTAPGQRSKTPALDHFGSDLTALAAQGRLDAVIGREQEIAQTVEILARRRKNNAVLIGEAGVGKTAIAEGIAQRIHDGGVPAQLADHRLINLDLSGLLAGASMRGQFEARLRAALDEASDPDNKVILFVDELHTILGAGAAEGAMDAANMFKPMLARGDLRLIGATTMAEYRKIEKDAALARRFSAVTVDAPSVAETVEILRGLRDAYQDHHSVTISDAALDAAALLADRYITDYQLPDKAIDLVDQAAAKAAIAAGPHVGEREQLTAELVGMEQAKAKAAREENYEAAALAKHREEQIKARLAQLADQPQAAAAQVGPAEIAQIIAARTGVPVGELLDDEAARLLALEEDLHEHVVGQDDAVGLVADAIRRSRVGLAKRAKRPVGTFLFLGPTGVGKTELVKALARRLFGREDAMVRLDMSEFMEKHTVARLIGSPPGYVGYGEGGQLTEPIRRRPYSVVLLDEIEKAHPDVFNVLLALMDDGRLTDGEGRTVDFTNTIVVMTSNLGAGRASRPLGFAGDHDDEQAKERMLAAAERAFLPEFLNRIDEIVSFDALSPDQLARIARMMVDDLARTLREDHQVELVISDADVAHLAAQGSDEKYGARPLARHLRRTVERALTQALLDGSLTAGQTATISLDEQHQPQLVAA